MKTTKSIAAYAMLLGTLLATNLVQMAHAGGIRKSSTKIAHRTQFDVLGHLLIEATGMRNDVVRTRNAGPVGISISNIEEDAGMYRDRGKSSPKIAHRTRRAPVTINVVDMVDVYFDLLDVGEYELADEVGMEVEDMVREMGYWRGGR